MELKNLRRRQFVKGSASALALTSFPALKALGQTGLEYRVEWRNFTGSRRTAFVNAIGSMRNNTNSSSPLSLQYWANIHRNSCPHGVPYFKAWHRGFLYYFERALKAVANDETMTIPYWDYYQYSTIPPEFNDPGSPLYMSRQNTNVYSALSLTPFGSTLVNFPRGMSSAYEPSVEYKPHNAFHNVIGNTLATMQSPLDPIFWLHHSQVDRLWVAWLNKGGGRQMPPASDAYWSGSFTYSGHSLQRIQTIDTRTYLGYRYDNETAPTSLPSQTATSAAAKGAEDVALDKGVPPRPPLGKYKLSPPRDIAPGRRSIGGALNVNLGDTSLSVQIPLSPADRRALHALLDRLRQPARNKPEASPYDSVKVVLDDLLVSGAGLQGGYFYNVYLNLPAGGGGEGSEPLYLLGGIGPFEIDGARHHRAHHNAHHHATVQLGYEATLLLKESLSRDDRSITLSFVRVSGERTPRGRTITICEARVELCAEGA
ncbi:MAG TPA: tyrosinase family protein [Paucimonas sp.]|nr:tyrosinase family protein [Paucimonas sp.]